MASRDELVNAMRASIVGMIARGIHGCADFREGGNDGVSSLKEAAGGLSFGTCIFGRDGGEETGDGLGISSVRDVHDAEHQVTEARGERVRKSRFTQGNAMQRTSMRLLLSAPI